VGQGPEVGMRLRFGVAMAPKGGRTAIVGAEVRETRDARGRLVHAYEVGFLERVPGTLEASGDRVQELVEALAAERPCVFVDIGSAQGMALRASMRGRWDTSHRAHAYPGSGERTELFAEFLQAYSTGRVRFRPGLEHRKELDKALVNYLGGGVAKTGVDLTSEDEALVIALGLALHWPRHGWPAAKMEETESALEG
jgi:hypothetical protein